MRIAAAQAAQVVLDRAAMVTKACELIAQAGRQDIGLLALPESFIPANPDWVWAVPAGGEDLLTCQLARTKVDIGFGRAFYPPRRI